MMRILVISNLCPPDYDGGFELSALRNAQSLIDMGHSVDFVTSNYRSTYQGERNDPPYVHRIFSIVEAEGGWSNDERFQSGESELGFQFKHVLKGLATRKANIKTLWKTLNIAGRNETEMRHFLLGREYDAVYVFGLHYIGASVLQPITEMGIPILYHHGDEWLAFYLRPHGLKKFFLTAHSPRRYPREKSIDLSHIVLVSEFLKRRFKAVGFQDSQLGVIYRGVEFPLQHDVDRERFWPPVFLIASRLTLYKGVHIAIKAAASLHRRSPELPWELWIAGHGDANSMAYFESLAHELGVKHRVRFIGKHTRTSVLEHMQRATAVIMPSIFDEPFGNTNIEAMASGTPLIASRSGAIEEIITHQETGMIYDRADFEELSRCMETVLNDPELRRRLAVNALRTVEDRFTQRVVMGEVEARLTELAGAAKKSRIERPSITLR